MGDGDRIHHKQDVVQRVEQLIGNSMPQIGGDCHDQQSSEDAVSRAHDLRCELYTEGLRAILRQRLRSVYLLVAHLSEEQKEHQSAKENDGNHEVSQVDVHV